MTMRPPVFGVCAALLLCACSSVVDSDSRQRDARKEAQARTLAAAAQAQLDLVAAQTNNTIPATASARAVGSANRKIAKAQYVFDKARAEADFESARTRCAEKSGTIRAACFDSAQAIYNSEIAGAKSLNEQADKRNAR
jgi:hypothetical protein